MCFCTLGDARRLRITGRSVLSSVNGRWEYQVGGKQINNDDCHAGHAGAGENRSTEKMGNAESYLVFQLMPTEQKANRQDTSFGRHLGPVSIEGLMTKLLKFVAGGEHATTTLMMCRCSLLSGGSTLLIVLLSP